MLKIAVSLILALRDSRSAGNETRLVNTFEQYCIIPHPDTEN